MPKNEARKRHMRREYFAAKAMNGLIACCEGWPMHDDYNEIARRAFALADAMIAHADTPVPSTPDQTQE